MKNLYDILGVPQNADREEIKRAYRKLSKKYHPDIKPGDREAAEIFAQVSEAYSILQDTEKRRRYDLSLKRAPRCCTGQKSTAKKENSMKTERKANPIDVTDLFEQFMGIRM